MQDYAHYDATALAALVRARDVSATELVEAVIARVERLDGEVNAVIYRDFDQARETAAQPLPSGPFTGVPFIVKDFGIGVAGWPCSSGSRFAATSSIATIPAWLAVTGNPAS